MDHSKHIVQLEVALAAIIWGSTGAFAKYLQLPPTTMSFFRLAVPFFFLTAYFFMRKEAIPFRGNKLILIASGLNTLRLILYFWAYTLTSIGNAVVIL